jgi:ketosteroid isomerase-like protein
MAALYAKTDDVVSYPPDVLELRGWQAIADAAVKSMAAGPGGKLELTTASHRVAGDLVLTWGLWKMTLPAEDGAAPVEIVGRYSDVKGQVDGAWVYLMDHASIAPEPPPAASP